nr:MAG TPA: hypothetical protein [Caudoviricetes sp.]
MRRFALLHGNWFWYFCWHQGLHSLGVINKSGMERYPWLNPQQNAKQLNAPGRTQPVNANLNWCSMSRNWRWWSRIAPPDARGESRMIWASTSHC